MLNALWKTPWWGLGLAGSIRYSDGSPINPTVGSDINLDGQSGTDRPTVGGVHFGRNSFNQPPFKTLDLRLSKEFGLGPG